MFVCKHFLERRWCTIALLVLSLVNHVPAWSNYDSRGHHLDESVTDFTCDIFKNVVKTAEDNDNIFLSPFSVQMILSLLAEGASGKTAAQMRQALKVPQDARSNLDHFFKILKDIEQGNENPRLQFTIANKLYVRKGFKLNPTFNSTVQGFDTGIDNINFARSKPSSDKINKWVAMRTHNKIPQIISPEDITSTTSLVLINALHFDAKWHKTFDSKNTTMEKFYGINRKTYEVPMMKQKLRTRYANLEEYGFEVVDIPYHNFEYTMTIILPRDMQTNDFTSNKIDETINVIRTQVSSNSDVNLELPRFTIEDTTNYDEILKSKMPDAFTEQADFRNLVADPRQTININKVISKAVMETNEEGTVAAAASAIGAVTLSVPQYIPEVDMKINRPFIFLISNRRNNAPYFIGRYMHP